MFAAVLDITGAPVRMPRLAVDGDFETIALGTAKQIVFVRSRPSVHDHAPMANVERLDERGLALLGVVRLDARADLEARLSGRGHGPMATATDAALCLASYAEWGERCLDFLAGDFAFVLWDDRRQCLFSARDQMGIRSLFHARRGPLFAIGNDLDMLAGGFAPDRVPDDCWIADFLTLVNSREFERTVYRDVRRLPPAHLLNWQVGKASPGTRRYWKLDPGEPLFLPRDADYEEQFRAVVTRAIADRVPAGTVGIAMSGGLDSTTLAACTVELLGNPRRVVTYCEHYRHMMHIGEDVFAGMAARHLGIDLHIEPYDDAVYDPAWQSRGLRPPEPMEFVTNAACVQAVNDRLALRSSVWFEGEGPDNALQLDRDPYLSWLRSRHAWGRLSRTLFDYARVKGLSGWMQSVRRHARWEAPAPERFVQVPRWISPDLARRVRLDQRIADLGEGGDTGHPWHPAAVGSFTSPIWQDFLFDFEVQERLSPIQWRHPFLDLRVLDFLLRVPPVPWAWKKNLLRRAMRGRLPDPILRRPKTPLSVYPRGVALRKHGLPPLMAPDRLEGFVDKARLPGLEETDVALHQSIYAYVLDHWLATMPAPGLPTASL